jgi:hypothetical protein
MYVIMILSKELAAFLSQGLQSGTVHHRYGSGTHYPGLSIILIEIVTAHLLRKRVFTLEKMLGQCAVVQSFRQDFRL